MWRPGTSLAEWDGEEYELVGISGTGGAFNALATWDGLVTGVGETEGEIREAGRGYVAGREA